MAEEIKPPVSDYVAKDPWSLEQHGRVDQRIFNAEEVEFVEPSQITVYLNVVGMWKQFGSTKYPLRYVKFSRAVPIF